jgi:hypothetical protein
MRSGAAANQSLVQMQRHLSTPIESQCVGYITAAFIDAQEEFSKAIELGHLYTLMRSPKDADTVRDHFALSAQEAVELGSLQLGQINDCMRDLTTPTVLAEATEVRDAAQKIIELLRPFAAKS